MTTYSKPGALKDLEPGLAKLFTSKSIASLDQRYQDQREVGHGSFGTVYYAIDTKHDYLHTAAASKFDDGNNVVVAIKKMSYGGKSSAALEKWNDIIKEIKCLALCQVHDNIVRHYTCHLTEDCVWLVMEYCIGSASDVIETIYNDINEADVAAITVQTLQGLTFLHSKRIIHRDVKAGNILLFEQSKGVGLAKLGDFGSASDKAPANSFVGTPYWMAPEVILAMEDGEYDVRVDIWSLGITCIELAERRPPFFNKNAMSALYQIAQSEAPRLSRKPTTSEHFYNFVASILVKDPNCRPFAHACLEHEFISPFIRRSSSILYNLIIQTKHAVRGLDETRLKKGKKIIENLANNYNTNSLDSNGTTNSSAESIKSRDSDEEHSEQESGDGSRDVPRNETTQDMTIQSSDSVESVREVFTINRQVQLTHGAVSDPSNPNGHQPGQHSNQYSPNSRPQDEFLEAQRTRKRFATLRSVQTLAKIQREVAKPNEILEQLNGYKRLRQQQRKELEQLDMSNTTELTKHVERNNREISQLRAQHQTEFEKHCKKITSDLAKFAKTQEVADKKLTKQLMELQEQKLKEFKIVQRKEYKREKELLKNTSKTQIGSSQRSVWLNGKIEEAKGVYASKETAFINQNRMTFALERRKALRRHLLEKHNLERLSINDDVRWSHVETEKGCVIRQHEQTVVLRHKHFDQREDLRKKQITVQHDTERTNQEQYMKQCKDQLKRKHAKENAAQPRALKEKERILKQTYRSKVSQLESEFTQYKRRIRAMQVSSSEKKAIIKRQREDHDRLLNTLVTQYQESVEQMNAQEKFELSQSQKEEVKLQNDKLSKEMEQLFAYQSQIKFASEKQKSQDYSKLKQSLQESLQKTNERYRDRQIELQTEINRRLEQLKEDHRKQLVQFDEVSRQMGFHTIFHSREGSGTSSPRPVRHSLEGRPSNEFYHQGETTQYSSSSGVASRPPSSTATHYPNGYHNQAMSRTPSSILSSGSRVTANGSMTPTQSTEASPAPQRHGNGPVVGLSYTNHSQW